jgi:DNA-binding IclR family transcriptional regulator
MADADDGPAEENGEAAGGGGKRSYSVPAAEKALDIIEFMAGQPDGLTLTEIGAALNRSVHELYRVIQTLEARGYLYRPPESDRYRFSLKLFELAHQMPSVRQLSDSALPVMQTLAPAAQQSCHLVVLSGHEALIVTQVDSPLPMRYSVMLGAKFEFAETSSGVVIYAYSRPALREQLDAWLASHGAAESNAVQKRAAAIVAAGYEVQPSLAVSGVTNISVPIFDYLGHVIAALTVPYMPQRAAIVPRERVLELALEASGRISSNLGAGARRTSPASGGRPG